MRIVRIEHDGSARFGRASEAGEVELWSAAPWAGGQATGSLIARASVPILAPVTPSKIVCVGRNYAAHAKELGNQVPEEPLLFLKPPSALIAPEAAIVLPAASQQVEHEAEIGVVLGKRLRRGSAEEAGAAIFGITCVNDVTARDLQRKDVQFTRAKSFDTFCPVGPFIETAFDPAALTVRCRVNGELRQDGHADQMMFSISALLSFISHVMTLEPGDLVSTGTPSGVGVLVPNDTVEVEIGGVGVLRNRVLAGKA